MKLFTRVVFLVLFLVQKHFILADTSFIPVPKKFSDKTFHTKFDKMEAQGDATNR